MSFFYFYNYFFVTVVISDPQHKECSNLTETRWAQYICNHENNVHSWLSPQ